MAGRTKTRAARKELQRRAIEELGENATPLDLICELTENGKTLTDIATEVSAALGYEVSRTLVRRAAFDGHSEEAAEQRLAQARARGAATLVEEGFAEAQATPADKDQIAKQKLLNELRHYIAGVWNRQEYGQQRQAGVQVNIGTLHLDALRTTHLIDNPMQHAEVIAAQEVTQLLPGVDAAQDA
jgi:hypothetical protein